MITFLSLFLGLTLGQQTVEVRVDERVAAVEILLDETVVGRLDQPPWRLEVDFGDPRPQQLVARALDARDQEIERTTQWINLPRPRAELDVVLQDPAPDGTRIALVNWQTIAGDPRSIRATLDGEVLPIVDPRRILLPPVEGEGLHFLRVEVAFNEDLSVVEERLFGSSYTAETAGELTAILLRGKRAPKLEKLRGKLTLDGDPLEIVAIERGPTDLVVVTDLDYFGEDLDRLTGFVERDIFSGAIGVDRSLENRFTIEWKVTPNQEAARSLWTFEAGDRVRWMFARPQQAEGGDYAIYPSTPPLDLETEGLYYHLVGFQEELAGKGGLQQFVEATAAAGMKAARGRHRRAVILLLSSRPQDASRLRIEQAQSYLNDLQVPLYVWWPGLERGKEKDPKPEGWDVRPTRSREDTEWAYTALRKDLDSQWVVWVRGLHLPNKVRLADGVKYDLVR